MSKLQLILLGRFECLLSSGTRISLSMRKAEVLLAYLALTPGLRHPRERLINLLWSDRGEEQARNSLRQCLSAIRKSLGDMADLALQVDRSTVSLQPGLIEVDVLEFERLADIGDYESLTTAADLYQGEFLEGIAIRDAACQEWLDNERSRFKRQFIEILLNLAETQLVSHDFGHAIKSAERLVKQDPLGESGWRLLMRSYFENGDRAHALQAFKRCQQALREELEVDPETATIELRDQIAGGETKPASTPIPTTTNSTAGPSSPTDHSIAVLPFDNLSGDPEQEYFSDGITDSIILNLSLFPGLQVKSRNSSFAFKQQIKSLGEISQELEVDYIVEGSIRKSADRIRITVQLIEAASGNQVWGKRYDAEIDNLFDLEEDLSRSIAATVTGQIESDLQRIAVAKGAAGQESYDLLLSGVYHAVRFNRQDTIIGIEKLNQCLAQDPDNVRAHVHLYNCHSMNYLERWVEDFRASFALAAAHIQKALELDPQSALVQAYYAEYLIFNGEEEKALKHINKALEINPSDPDAMTIMALYLELQGDFEVALEMAERSYRLDPYHPWVEWELAVSRYFCGQYEATLETIENARTSPSFTRIFSVSANIKLGRTDAAKEALQAFLRECRENMLSMPATLDEWTCYLRDNYLFKDTNNNEDVVQCLLAAGLEDEIAPRSRVNRGETNSVAVLPFDNLSGDTAQEYFSDGITESIILNLSLFPELSVKSRNSSFAFKQQIKSLGEISKELEVDYIVEGSVRKTDERVRVTVQLVEAQRGNQLWGKRYDAEIENLFDLEEELSRAIAATVTGQIESELRRIAITKGAADQKAYDLLLAGSYHANKSNPADYLIAIDKFDQCLALDPANALAHANLYDCHDMSVMDRWTDNIEKSKKLASEHINKAVSLDPESSLVKIRYADFLIFQHRYDDAEIQLQAVLEKNPNNSEAIAVRAINLSSRGKPEAALEQAELALKLDPYHGWARWIKSESLFFCGRYDDCLDTIANTGNAPGFIQVYNIAANVMLDRMDMARNALDNFLQFCRENMLAMPQTIDEWREYFRDNAPFADPAINDHIIDCLIKSGLEEHLPDAGKTGDTGILPAVVVLPFENISGDPEQEYFSDGITTSLILSLGLYKDLAIKSKNSSFAFRNSGKSSEDIASALKTDYLVEGTIRKSSGKVRISVQLIESKSGNQVWGKQYDAELENIFELEQELSQTIAATISGRIGHTLQQYAARKPAKNLQSYDYLLRGLYRMGKFTAPDLKNAKKDIGKCLEIDPDNAAAHFTMGEIHFVEALENWTSDPKKSGELAGQHLARAIELEPDNASAHAYMADFLNWKGDFVQSEFHADKAIELNPTASEGYFVKADFFRLTGRAEQGVPYADKSLQLDPHSIGAGWSAGGVYLAAGLYDKAIKTFRSMPHAPASIQAQIAAGFAGLGLPEEARKEMKHYQRLAREQLPSYPKNEQEWRAYWSDYTAFQNNSDFDEIFDLLKNAGLCEDLLDNVDEMPSIAVLPFENMSGDPEQEHFSDGITADLISTLFKFRHLRAVSFYSTQQYKSLKVPIAEIAAQQRVRYILQGSVRKSGDRIRVNVELIDSSNEQILWSERFDRELDDMFTVQDEITRSIALTMKVQLDDGEMALHRSGTTNIKAWELVLTAIDLQDTYIRKNIVEARSMAQQAIELDPYYGYAWICLAWTFWQEVYSGWSDSIDESMKEATRANQRARELNPEYSEAWTQAGAIHMMNHEADQAVECCRKGVMLEPGNAETQALTAYSYMFIGEYELAREHIRQMEKLCPVLPNWYYLIAGQVEQYRGNLGEAVQIMQQGVEVEPDSPLCRFYLIHALMELGDEAGARRCANEIRSLDRDVVGRGFVRSQSIDPAIRKRFQANLEKFDLY